MKREEAIGALERADGYVGIHYINGVEEAYINPHLREAVKVALTALRPVSREGVEKAWRGCSWCNNEGKKPENWECSLLDDRGFSVVVGDEVVWTNAEFCPVCGKPLTDEAVQMVMERMERIK